MRLNPEIQGVKASDLLNVLDQTPINTTFEKVISHNRSKELRVRIMSVRPINKVPELIKLLQGLPPQD